MNWKQKLLKLRATWYLNKYAGARDFGVPLPAAYNDTRNKALAKCICDWLKFNDHPFTRINDHKQFRFESVQLANGGLFKKPTVSHGAGNCILTAIIIDNQVVIEINCKAIKDRLRPEQLKEKQRIEAAGGIYFIATDMQTFVDFYEQAFATADVSI